MLMKQCFGARQGCIISPDLLNLYLEHIMRVALSRVKNFDRNEDGKAYISERRLDYLRFADEIALITRDSNTPKNNSKKWTNNVPGTVKK